MKALRSWKVILSTMLSLLFLASPLFAQDESDDMYFNQKDRKKVKSESVAKVNKKSSKDDQIVAKNNSAEPINATYSSSEYGDINDNYSSKTVNPEYISRYSSNSKEDLESTDLSEGDAYYVENYNRDEFEKESALESATNKYTYPSSFNNYYPYMGYNSMARMDPFWGHTAMAPSWNMGMRYGFGYRPGWSMSLSFGSGYGGFYDPWMMGGYQGMYNPYGYYYDPFMDPWMMSSYYGSMYRPYYGGYNTMYIGSMNYYYGGNSCWVSSVDVSSKKKYQNRVTRGGDNNIRNTNSESNTRTTVANGRVQATATQADGSSARTSRDYSKNQNEYYNQSRSRQSNTSAARTDLSTTSTSRSASVGTTSRPSVRSTRSDMDYSRPSYKSTRSQSSSSSGSYSSGAGRSSSSGYGSGSRSSYSSGSATRSSGSSSALSGGSRSSGSSSSSGSRSSSGSSSGGSRSSGRGN